MVCNLQFLGQIGLSNLAVALSGSHNDISFAIRSVVSNNAARISDTDSIVKILTIGDDDTGPPGHC
jgi:hypothetical protein